MVFDDNSSPFLVDLSVVSLGSTPLFSSLIKSLFLMSTSNGFSIVIPRDSPFNKKFDPKLLINNEIINKL